MTRDLSVTCRALAHLLTYPDARLRGALPEIAAHLATDRALSAAAREALGALVDELRSGDPYEVEAAYVQCFDRGRSTSLLLFEHVHGDSRERGQAMVDLLATYESAGLRLQAGQLPDHLPVALEFASTQPAQIALAFLAELSPVLNALHSALFARCSRYCAVIASVLELAGERVRHLAPPSEEPIDEAWAEPAAFGGCTSRGQSRPGSEQPVHFVRSVPAARRSASPLPGAAR